MKQEESLQKAICRYLSLQYPDVMYVSDMSGYRLPIGLAKLAKITRSDRGWPVLFIAEPRMNWHGMFIELKKSRDEVFRKDGSLRESQHIKEQYEIMQRLLAKDYYAIWGTGFDNTKTAIDNYLKLPI